MEVLPRGGEIADLHVLFGAKLKVTLESSAGVFRALSFVTVRQQQHDAAWPLPFRFRRGNELIDDGLRAVREVPELRLPQAEHARIIERITVIKTKHSGFGQETVINTNAGLFPR